MKLDQLDRRIVELIQSEFPLEPRPFKALAERVGSNEDETLERVRRLQAQGVIREISPVFDLHRLGYTSTLCAAKAAPASIERAASLISKFPEVTHNYLRDHEFNLWFTLIAPSKEQIDAIVSQIRDDPAVATVVPLPATKTFKINVHFATVGDEP